MALNGRARLRRAGFPGFLSGNAPRTPSRALPTCDRPEDDTDSAATTDDEWVDVHTITPDVPGLDPLDPLTEDDVTWYKPDTPTPTPTPAATPSPNTSTA